MRRVGPRLPARRGANATIGRRQTSGAWRHASPPRRGVDQVGGAAGRFCDGSCGGGETAPAAGAIISTVAFRTLRRGSGKHQLPAEEYNAARDSSGQYPRRRTVPSRVCEASSFSRSLPASRDPRRARGVLARTSWEGRRGLSRSAMLLPRFDGADVEQVSRLQVQLLKNGCAFFGRESGRRNGWRPLYVTVIRSTGQPR